MFDMKSRLFFCLLLFTFLSHLSRSSSLRNHPMESKIKVPSSSIKYIVPKGFVCVDGTSLTICEVDAENSTFTFMLVAHTQQNVIIPSKLIGTLFNLFLYWASLPPFSLLFHAATLSVLFSVILRYEMYLSNIKLGEKVNIEVDVLAKMVERSLAGVKDAAIAALEQRVGELTQRVRELEMADLKGRDPARL
jgi:riboflavin synthase alpha subunit